MYFRLTWPLLAVAAITYGQTITNFAGNGTAGFAGDGGPATAAQINRVVGLATDAAGNVYMAEENSNVVRKVDTNGIITTFAGTTVRGFTGDGGQANQAQLNGPLGVCVAPSGVVYVNDQGNHRVRAISTSGVITTVAGSGSTVSFGDGGPATSAGMVIPIRCAVDQSGNLYIVDQGAHVIRKVNTSGTISTFAGISNAAGFSGDGGPANQAQMNNPTADSFDAAGNLYVTDQSNHRIRKINTNGIITTVAGNGSNGFTGDGGSATSASLNFPGETVIDSAGTIFIVDTINQVIRKVAGGVISTVAGTPGSTGSNGDSGPPLQARLNMPFAITLDKSGNLYVGDTINNRVRKISNLAAAPAPCTYALSPGGQAFSAAGGNGSIAVTAPTGCAWSLSNAPSWVINPTSGSGNGTLTYQVTANAGAARSATMTVAGVSFAVEQSAGAISGLAAGGSLAQVTSEGTWDFTLNAINLGGSAAAARFSFFNDGGNPLTLPLTFPQSPGAGGPLLAATLDRTISPNAQIVIRSTGPDNVPQLIGWGQLQSNGNVAAFGTFSDPALGWNAVVPLETRNASKYILAFDNTGNLSTGVAVASIAGPASNVNTVIRDDNGVQIGTPTIALAALGHTSFMLNQQFAITAGKRGTIEFDTPAGGQISVLGLRAYGIAALTTLPALANVTTSGGSITHATYNGGFTSSFYIVNTGTASANFTLSFFDESGNPLTVPLSLPQSGSTMTTSSLTQSLAAGAMLVLDTQAQDALASVVGSASLTTTGNISGFEVFRWTTFNQEASVPLETRSPSSYVLVFDNTSDLTTGVALANLAQAGANITVNLRDDTGNLLQSAVIPLAGRGHTSFLLPNNYGVTANKRGMAEFVVPGGGQISAIGLRAKADGTLTTIPILAK